MHKALRSWFRNMWKSSEKDVMASYPLAFQTFHGQIVLQHMLDTIYCTVYHGSDPNGALIHNARRSVVNEILVNIDFGQNPKKYNLNVKTEEESVNGSR